jgi:methylenetetrahydrofolate reductase (NADPH)
MEATWSWMEGGWASVPEETATNFALSVEVVPPAGHDAGPLLAALASVCHLPIDRFSVATNPVAKPRLSALTLCALIQQRLERPATLHCTTRDQNRLSLQSMLWGARAMGIDTVLVATGDAVALGISARTTAVHDLDVYRLVVMARETGLHTGVVFDPRPELDGLVHQVRRLEKKVEAGAQYAVSQPVYDEAYARTIHEATRYLGIPIILGILPLRTARHAEFLHEKVAGIVVPQEVRARMAGARDPVAEGVAGARKMLVLARQWFAGACLMPPFNHYEVLEDILR